MVLLKTYLPHRTITLFTTEIPYVPFLAYYTNHTTKTLSHINFDTLHALVHLNLTCA